MPAAIQPHHLLVVVAAVATVSHISRVPGILLLTEQALTVGTKLNKKWQRLINKLSLLSNTIFKV